MTYLFLTSLLSPDWLKYGFTGLVAIFAILMYFIFKPIINQDVNNRRLWVILFISISVVLLGAGGTYIYSSEGRTNTNEKVANSYKRNLDSLKNIINAQVFKLNIYTNKIPKNDSLSKLLKRQEHEYDSLLGISTAYKKKFLYQQEIVNTLVNQDIQESLENDLIATSGKSRLSLQIKNLEYKRLKNAVFLNFTSFNADKNVLRSVFNSLIKQSNEFKKSDTDRILAEYTSLMKLRLKWIKEQAIPALTESVNALEAHPERQEQVHASVKLPDEVIILPVDDAHGGNSSYVTDMQALKRERDMLVKQLTK